MCSVDIYIINFWNLFGQMIVTKMCGAMGQNVCMVCVILTILHTGGEAKSKRFEDPLSTTRSELASLRGRQLAGKFGPKSSASTEPRSNVTQEFLEGAITEQSRFFMKKLFQKYGSGGLMTFEGFEHFLENIGLAGIRIVDHDLADHQAAGEFISLHNRDHQHTKSESSSSTIEDGEETLHSNGDHHDHDHGHDHEHDHEYDSHTEDTGGHKTQDHRKRKERDLTDVKEKPISNKIGSGNRQKRRIHSQSVKLVSEKSSRLISRHIRGIDKDDHNHGSHEDHDHGSHHEHLSHADHGAHSDHGAGSKHSTHGHEHDDHTETTTIPILTSTRAKNSKKSSRKRGRTQVSNRRNRKTTETPIVAGSSLSPALHSDTLEAKLRLPCPDGALTCQKKVKL